MQNPAPNSVQSDASLLEAKSLMERGLVRDAERAVRRHLELHSDSAEGHFLLGYILFREIRTEARLETIVEGEKNLDLRPPESKTLDEKIMRSLAGFIADAKYHDPNATHLHIAAHA